MNNKSREIIQHLSGKRFSLSDEKRLQAEMEETFTAAGIEYDREYRLSHKDIIDFKIGRIGIEVKIKGGKLNIHRQIERYAASDELDEIILATNVATGMPETIKDKKIHVFNLGRAWL